MAEEILSTHLVIGKHRDKAMRAECQSRIYILHTSESDEPWSARHVLVCSYLVLAFGCSAGILSGSPLRIFIATVVAFAILRPSWRTPAEERPPWKRELPVWAPSFVFETAVTFAALSMRLSPIERDFVAVSLVALRCRIRRPSPRERRPREEPCPSNQSGSGKSGHAGSWRLS